MKRNENPERASRLALHRETLRSLETDLRLVRGGDEPAAATPSVQFCTDGCPPTGA